MGAKTEHQAQHIGQHQHDRNVEAEAAFETDGPLSHDLVEDGRQHEPDRSEKKHRGTHARRRPVEPLDGGKLQASNQDAQSEDEEQVADDRAGQRSFDDVHQASSQRHDRDDQLRRIAERGVEEASPTGSEMLGQTLCGAPHVTGEGNDGHGGHDEHRCAVQAEDPLHGHRRRYEREKGEENAVDRESPAPPRT